MFQFILRRLLIALPTLFVLIAATFLMMHLAPGGPFTAEKPLPDEVMANLEAKYGLDEPLVRQFGTYLYDLMTDFDFGPSFVFKDLSVRDIILQGFPVTLTYGFWAFIVAISVGIPLGVAAAMHQNSWLDYLAVGVSIGAQVLPNFVMAPILVLIFTLWLGWLPGGGWQGGQIEYVIMPVIALSTSFMASVARMTRSSMLEILRSNFIRTARAKGLNGTSVIWRHALKPAMLPVISFLGPVFVAMITGSVIIDYYFGTGGIGQFFTNAALSRDYGVMMGVTILIGALTILFTTVVDILYAWIDPRIRY